MQIKLTKETRRNHISAIRRRLEKLELGHLRAHAVELADKVERLQVDLEYAESAAISWRDDCLRLMQESLPQGGAIGLGVDGSLHVLPAFTAQPGFVIVPETTLPSGLVVPAFQVAQHVASKGDGGTVSISATGKPWTNINFADAKQACADVGYSMITETQWLAIAWNASQVDENWTGGKVGEGSMHQGIRFGGGAKPGDYKPANEEERRWLVLSNGSRVCDFNGNVFQWVFDDVQGDEKGLIAKSITLNSISQSTAPYPSEQKGMGWRPDGDRDWSGRALVRGGCWYSCGYAGVFRLSDGWPDYEGDYVGFRCTKPSGI